MLSFEVNGNKIEIQCDSVGMGTLLSALSGLVMERGGHIHLWAPSVGGQDLSDKTPFGAPAVGEVVIDFMEGDPLENK